MISNGTIPNDGCSTDGPSSPKGTVPWVQLFGSTSHLFLTIWCMAYVLLSVDILEEHLDLGWGPFFLRSWRNTEHAQILRMLLKHKAKLYFMQSVSLQLKVSRLQLSRAFLYSRSASQIHGSPLLPLWQLLGCAPCLQGNCTKIFFPAAKSA